MSVVRSSAVGAAWSPQHSRSLGQRRRKCPKNTRWLSIAYCSLARLICPFWVFCELEQDGCASHCGCFVVPVALLTLEGALLHHCYVDALPPSSLTHLLICSVPQSARAALQEQG